MSFIWYWLRDSLYTFLGLAHKSGSVLFIGLDFSGKTTLMNLLKTGKFSAHAPTGIGTSEEFMVRTGPGGENLKLTGIDLGGHKQIRRIWRDYYHGIDAIFFLIDATDRKRLRQAAEELHGLLSDPLLVSSSVPIAILGNKIDLMGAMGEAELVYSLGLYDKISGKTPEDSRFKEGGKEQPLEVFMCSFLRRQGYGEAFRWVAQFLK